MIYEIVRIAHLASIVLWIGSAITAPMVLLALKDRQIGDASLPVNAARYAYVRLGGVGIVGTWAFGLTLLSIGNWFDAPWMWAKLAVVMILSGLHGAMSGRMKRLAWDGKDIPTGFFKTLLVLHGVGLIAVLTLVILKPF